MRIKPTVEAKTKMPAKIANNYGSRSNVLLFICDENAFFPANGKVR